MSGSELCKACSRLRIEACFPTSKNHDLVPRLRNTLPLREWMFVQNLRPECPLCHLIFWATPLSFTQKWPKETMSPNIPTRSDRFSYTPVEHVITVRLAPLRELDEVALRTLRTASTEDIIVLDIHKSIRRMDKGKLLHFRPQTLEGCLISCRSEFKLFNAIDPQRVDIRRVRKWYEFCINNHRTGRRGCTSDTQFKVPYFRVIDCKERRIVPYCNKPYLALSYVWGRTQEKFQHMVGREGELLSTLAQTLEDAILVTTMLGFCYLWVDRYCIDQSNNVEVREQVTRMDEIYEHAQLTIIAVAGEDPSYGLPGISTQTRHQQVQGSIRDKSFLSLPSDPVRLVKRSMWNKRGWTYQEGLLSRRRVIFTDSEVYFECWGMACRECIDAPLEELHKTDLTRFTAAKHPKTKGAFPYGVGSNASDLFERIQEYRRREFRFDSDILDGFLGILRCYYVQFGVENVWGVPIIPRPITRKKKENKKGQMWCTTKSFFAGLLASDLGFRRRFGFPSWSWTGWSLDYFDSGLREYPHALYHSDLDFRIELNDGSICTWSEFSRHDYIQRQAVLSPYIYLKLWQFPVKLELSDNERCWKVRFESLYENRPYYCDLSKSSRDVTVQDSIHEKCTKALFTFRLDTDVATSWGEFPIWIVYPTDRGCYELFGVSKVSRVNLQTLKSSFDTIRLG